MIESLGFAVEVTLPISLIILLGIVLKKRNWINDDFVDLGSKLVFNLTLPCLLFVNKHQESEELGTDFYNADLKKIKTLPYRDNYGYFFSSGPNTWHGMEKKEIKKERRCLQVNYVTFKTDWKVNI